MKRDIDSSSPPETVKNFFIIIQMSRKKGFSEQISIQAKGKNQESLLYESLLSPPPFYKRKNVYVLPFCRTSIEPPPSDTKLTMRSQFPEKS